MRVAHLLRKYDLTEWGGTETATQGLAAGLAAQGVESIVFAPTPAQQSVAPDPLVAVGCQIRRFRARVPVWGISAERKRQLVAVGGNVISFDLFGGLWREPGLEVIHSHALGRLGAIGRAVAQRRRLPFVVSVHGGVYDLPATVRDALNPASEHGWDWGKPLGLMLRSRHLFSEADAIITCNPSEAALIRERHPDRRVLVQPHGVPASLFAVDQRAAALAAFPVVRGRQMLLVPGRLDPTKNQGWLVAQAGELMRRHPEILLVFVGACTKQAYGDALRDQIAQAHLGDHILLAGMLPSRDPRLIGLFQEARAVVLPSTSETFGLVILESWAAGTPVISSRTSGASALVKDGTNGWLFDLADPAKFHRVVDLLLADPAHGRQWGAAGRATALAEYDTAVLAGRIRRLYETLIEEKNALRDPAR